MSFFSSDRERRLWLWVLVVLVAIYSTLGATRAVVEVLREHNLLQISSVLVLLVMVTGIVYRWVETRPGWSEVGVGFGIAFVYFMALARIPHPEERTHLMEYGIVAVFIHMALVERRRNGRRVPAPAALAVAATALLGWIDEGIQSALPNRFYDLRDVGFNVLAGLMAIGASLSLGWARRSLKSRKQPDGEEFRKPPSKLRK